MYNGSSVLRISRDSLEGEQSHEVGLADKLAHDERRARHGGAPVAANPIVQSSAPDASANPQGLMWAWEGGCTVRPFLAIVTNPASASLDPSELQHQLARLNALNAMSLAGQGSLGELSISQLDMASTIALAVADQITTDDAMLVQAETAQDLLAALIGLPMLGIDGLASVDVLAAGGDVDAALAALLDGVTNLTFDQILSDAADAANGDGVNFASSAEASLGMAVICTMGPPALQAAAR